MPQLDRVDDVFVLDLGNTENRFHPDWLTEVEQSLDVVERTDGPRALVTTATGKFFSNGLDLEWLGAHGDQTAGYVARVQQLFARVLALPVVTVAALQGHTFAAGAMLALAHDHRVMRADRGFWCLPEVDLGMPFAAGMSALDWLITPQQRLLGVVSGAVYADDGGALERVRRTLAWYPDPVWRWLLACQWRRLGHEEAFVARTADVGDESGSAVTGARLARDVMRLALLLDRRYAPYQKWLGTAFARGRHEDRLPEHLRAALHAADRHAREAALAQAYEALARRHNEAGLTPPLDPSTRDYHDRPARVLLADRFASALLDTVTDTALRGLPLIGSVDQVVDSTDVLQAPREYRRLGVLYPNVARTPSP